MSELGAGWLATQPLWDRSLPAHALRTARRLFRSSVLDLTLRFLSRAPLAGVTPCMQVGAVGWCPGWLDSQLIQL